MKGYKAFGKGMICAPDKQHVKQYAENTVYEEDSAEVCKKGMHFCKDPLAVLDYYPLVDENGEMSEFAKVEALDEYLYIRRGYFLRKSKGVRIIAKRN